MEEKWTVGSVNGQTTGKEGEWKSLDQIQGSQTLLIDNILGISFRIIPNGDNYKISQVSVNPANIYYRLMEKEGINIQKAYEEIERQLTNGEWTKTNVQGLLDYGVVEGISTRLNLIDQERHLLGQQSNIFLANKGIETMSQIEWDEFYYLKPFITDKERLDYLEKIQSRKYFTYQKYKERVEGHEKSKTEGAQYILEFMKRNNLTTEDLSMALSMAQAEKTNPIEPEKKGDSSPMEL